MNIALGIIAVWLLINAAFVALRLYVTRPERLYRTDDLQPHDALQSRTGRLVHIQSFRHGA